MPGRLESKVALITGAARGQGRSHAVRLAEEGADIIAIDLCGQIDSVPYPMATREELNETVAQVEALDRRIVTKVADVRDAAALKAAVDSAVEQLGRLDIVCANAGIMGIGRVDELAEDAWQNMIDVNLTGVWHTATAAIPHIRAGGRGGSIIITSSSAALVAMQNIAHYVSAKFGVVGLMKVLALELAPELIRVNSLHPTNVDTPMIMNQAVRKLLVPDSEDPTDEQFAAAAQPINALPIPWVESIDVSNALLFLASDEARYITGATLPVDAGYSLK